MFDLSLWMYWALAFMLFAAFFLWSIQRKDEMSKMDYGNCTIHVVAFCFQLFIFSSGMINKAEVQYEKQQYIEALEMEQQEYDDGLPNPKD
ncbi:hypothetical protein [Pseudomonas phage D6]|nr:hypothetical protein [Pseudomonas phage D6]